MRSLIFLLSAVCCISACSRNHNLSESDTFDVLGQALEVSKAHFSDDTCVVSKLQDPFPDIVTSWGTLETSEGPVSVRNIPGADVHNIPANLTAGRNVTPEDYGCAETIKFTQPVFSQVVAGDEDILVVMVELDRLCGPICGERYSLTFTKSDQVWRPDSHTLVATGLAH